MKALVLACACAVFVPVLSHGEAVAPRNSRHALFIGIGHYRDAAIPRLEGIVHDMDSAQRIADAMAIPRQNTVLLRDDEATAARIRQEIQALNQRVRDGDRVFVYYSGHGTRWLDSAAGQDTCTEGLLAVDGEVLPNRLVAEWLLPLTRKTDKMLVFYDACFSGGMAATPLRVPSATRSLGGLTPKFTPVGASAACATPSNFSTRSLALVLQDGGSRRENVVYVTATRPDEVSFDSAATGGLATSAWRDCFLGDARDADGSGAVTVDEVTACAQARLDRTFANVPEISGQHMTVTGNSAFVPAWVKPATAASVDRPTASTGAQTAPADILAEVHLQRDASRSVDVRLTRPVLRIEQDTLQMTIRSNREGYVYVAIAGSDGKSLYLLYPNERDRENHIGVGVPLVLPRGSWEVTASGPAGRDTLLVMVTDTPRRLDLLKAQAEGPFMKALLDEGGRSRLQSVLVNGYPPPSCLSAGAGDTSTRGVQRCSDAFGAALVTVEETW